MKFLKTTLMGTVSLVLGAAFAHNGRAAEMKQVELPELQQLLKFYKPIQELDVSFKQTKHLKEMDLDLNSEGHLHVIRPDQVTWEIEKPSPLKVVLGLDQVEITSGSGRTKTVQVLGKRQMAGQNAAQAFAMITPWLLLDAPALTRSYTVNKVDARRFVFVPRQKDIFSQVEVRLGEDGHLENMVLAEVSGDTMSIRFEKPKILRSQP